MSMLSNFKTKDDCKTQAECQRPGLNPGALNPDQLAEHIVNNRFPWYSPRFWHGMRLGTWLRHLGRHRLAISPSRVPLAVELLA